jgi:hypothetical protein
MLIWSAAQWSKAWGYIPSRFYGQGGAEYGRLEPGVKGRAGDEARRAWRARILLALNGAASGGGARAGRGPRVTPDEDARVEIDLSRKGFLYHCQ